MPMTSHNPLRSCFDKEVQFETTDIAIHLRHPFISMMTNNPLGNTSVQVLYPGHKKQLLFSVCYYIWLLSRIIKIKHFWGGGMFILTVFIAVEKRLKVGAGEQSIENGILAPPWGWFEKWRSPSIKKMFWRTFVPL